MADVGHLAALVFARMADRLAGISLDRQQAPAVNPAALTRFHRPSPKIKLWTSS
jgi:hypothetical protein